ncbi:hypothetical protein [Streptomyces sp. NPDC054887]
MSAVTIAAVLIALGIGLALGHWSALCQARREHRVAQLRAARIADIQNRRPENVPAADDNTAGLNLDLHDQCELLWGQPTRKEQT